METSWKKRSVLFLIILSLILPTITAGYWDSYEPLGISSGGSGGSGSTYSDAGINATISAINTTLWNRMLYSWDPNLAWQNQTNKFTEGQIFIHKSLAGVPEINITANTNDIVTGNSLLIDDTAALAVAATPVKVRSKATSAFEIWSTTGATPKIQFNTNGGMYLNFGSDASPFFNMRGASDINLIYARASVDSLGMGLIPVHANATEINKTLMFHSLVKDITGASDYLCIYANGTLYVDDTGC